MKMLNCFATGCLVLCAHNSVACLTSESENNNSQANANGDVCSGTLIESTISSRNDIDWYRFSTGANGAISVALQHNSRDDFDWRLVSASGQTLLRGETSSTPESDTLASALAGDYYLEVSRYRGTGWYDLSLDFVGGGSDGGSGGDGTPESGCNIGAAPAKSSGLSVSTVGSAADTCVSLNAGQGAVLLMGGGADVDTAFSNRVRNHVGNGADVVVLRTSGTDAYNTYLHGLLSADSVSTLIIDSRAKANEAYVNWAIRSAEFVWISGGDQAEYLNMWAGTAVQSALQSVYDRGGVVGGTSAGMALLSDTIYDPDGVAGAVSEEVVTDFCHETINLSPQFITIPVLANSLADTHFYERDRMGRLMVFMAHQTGNVVGIGASEGTSIFINSAGLGVVDGSYEVYVLRETNATNLQQGSCGSPVIYRDVSRVKLLSGDTYNFSNHSHSGDESTISIDGNSASFYTPSSPY